MTDQQRADICAREGFPLDTTPFLDRLANQGAWFNHAYTVMPACLPARVSLLTGRYPSATHARTNHNREDCVYDTDLVDVFRGLGYQTAVCGKNHSHLGPERVDHWYELSHEGAHGKPDTPPAEQAFDAFLNSLHHRTSMEPTPFAVEMQCPARAVRDAIQWIDTIKETEQPFFLWLTFPEPHNPYQVPEPYFSMFPPEVIPPNHVGKEGLEAKGFKFQWTRRIGEIAFPDYDQQLIRARSNYLGMLRLIDDQIQRFVENLEAIGMRENTILVFVADHGDFVGEYGLVRKGPEAPEVLARVPLFFVGPGIQHSQNPVNAFVSIADIMPTLCEAVGVEIPAGVQGRSLWPMLTGQEYPHEEFASAYVEQGFGGLHYTGNDPYDPYQDGLEESVSFDELNGWSQSGTLRAVIKGEWKLVYDMLGHGQLYHLAADPFEMQNLFGQPGCEEKQMELLEEMLQWVLKVQDPLPYPRRRYAFKRDPRNYTAPYR
jgi:arylsulfatase A-like enzyme